MISSLKGNLIHTGRNEIMLDVNGVGYNVYVSKKVLENLCPLNEIYHVLTHLDVKENSLTLYGFHDEREREIFKMLITVNGISSKTAHRILSYAAFEDIISLITNHNDFVKIKIPGIGPKKLDLISMTLRDKVFKISEDSGTRGKTIPEGSVVFAKEQSRLDALNALMNLGYARNEAEKLIREVLKENPDKDITTEELVKKALLYISS
jgi:Holliday junction DNA helicase RuvA